MSKPVYMDDLYRHAATLVHYDPETGVMTWRARAGADRETNRWNARHAGKQITGLHMGYLNLGVTVGGKTRLMKAHRLAWFIVYGEVPPEQIDHIDRNRSNNAISNLRLATNAENMRNKSLYKTNASGVPGVNRHSPSGKWHARVTTPSGKRLSLGLYRSLTEAAAVANVERQRLGLPVFSPVESEPCL